MTANQQTLTIASYNICRGYYAEFDWNVLARSVRQVNADLLGLQEVDVFSERIPGKIDTLAALREATGLNYGIYTPTIPMRSGRYGTAILSRYPIVSGGNLPLQSANFEPRALGYAKIILPNHSTFLFFNTHLCYKSADQRLIQFDQLATMLPSINTEGIPCALTGDFNTERFLDFEPILHNGMALINHAEDRMETFRLSPIAIDNIVYAPASMTPTAHGMIESNASDHNLIWARFNLL